jgi:hypothetical protein
MVYPALLPLIRTPRLPVVDWTDAPADLNGLVRFAERRKLVFCACAITFQTHSNCLACYLLHSNFNDWYIQCHCVLTACFIVRVWKCCCSCDFLRVLALRIVWREELRQSGARFCLGYPCLHHQGTILWQWRGCSLMTVTPPGWRSDFLTLVGTLLVAGPCSAWRNRYVTTEEIVLCLEESSCDMEGTIPWWWREAFPDDREWLLWRESFPNDEGKLSPMTGNYSFRGNHLVFKGIILWHGG